MSGRTSSPRHRRDDRVSRRVKVAATAITVVTMLLMIAMASGSHRLAATWRGHRVRDPVMTADPGVAEEPGRTTTRQAVSPPPHVTVPWTGHPGPSQRSTPDQPAGTTTTVPNWLGPVTPACDEGAPPAMSNQQPTATSSPVPGPAPATPATDTPATAPSTSDDMPPCRPSDDKTAYSDPPATPSLAP